MLNSMPYPLTSPGADVTKFPHVGWVLNPIVTSIFKAGLGTTSTAVVLQGPKIRLNRRFITSEAAGGLMSVHGTTMVGHQSAVCSVRACGLRVLAPQTHRVPTHERYT